MSEHFDYPAREDYPEEWSDSQCDNCDIAVFGMGRCSDDAACEDRAVSDELNEYDQSDKIYDAQFYDEDSRVYATASGEDFDLDNYEPFLGDPDEHRLDRAQDRYEKNLGWD